MKVYVVELTEYKDGTKPAAGVYTYEDKNAAIASYHKKMGGAMASENVLSELILVIKDDGEVIVDDKFPKKEAQDEEEKANG